MQNLMTAPGSLAFIVWFYKLKTARALQLYGTVCSTWIWMSRASTKRSLEAPLSDRGSATVVHSNVMVSRVSLLMLMGWCKMCDQMQEQPLSSLMFAHPRQKQVARFTQWNCVVMAMGAYGAATEKPTKLWSACSWKPYTPPPGSDPQLCTRDASGGVTGIPNALKESQTYPKGFGEEVCRLYTPWRASLKRLPVLIPNYLKPDDWVYAERCKVSQLCRVPQCYP